MSYGIRNGLDIPTRMGLDCEPYHRVGDQTAARLWVHIPGIIQSFDPNRQTVTVQPSIMEIINVKGAESNVQLPLLTDVPIALPRAGGYCLTLPITAGDECLVMLADCCIDAWWQSGGIGNIQMDLRRHDLSDGFALIGIWSQPRVISGYKTDRAQLRNDEGTAVIEVVGTTINVTAPVVNVGNSAVIIGDNTTIDGRVFLQHTHSGVKAGSDQSLGVV
jgi:hypothetical protein